jgi:hypothetical protein
MQANLRMQRWTGFRGHRIHMKNTILYILLATCIFSCKKQQHNTLKFPAETQTGANTLGCYIDGAAFIPSTTLQGLVHPITVLYNSQATPYEPAGFLSIQGIDARYNLNIAGSILVQKQNVTGPGEYALSHVFNCPQTYHCDGGGYRHADQDRYYYIESGKLIITRLDTVEKIISGRFYFTAKDTLGNKKEITGGVFDAKMVN